MPPTSDRRHVMKVLVRLLPATADTLMWLKPRRVALGERVEVRALGADVGWHEGVVVARDGDAYWVVPR